MDIIHFYELDYKAHWVIYIYCSILNFCSLESLQNILSLMPSNPSHSHELVHIFYLSISFLLLSTFYLISYVTSSPKVFFTLLKFWQFPVWILTFNIISILFSLYPKPETCCRVSTSFPSLLLHMHICVRTHTYTYFHSFSVLYICICLELTSWNWITYQETTPWEADFSLSRQSEIVWMSSLMSRTFWDFLLADWHINWCAIMRLCLGNILLGFPVSSVTCPLVLTAFPSPLLWYSLTLSCRGCCRCKHRRG